MNEILSPDITRIPDATGASPVMQQWFAAKAEHPEALLFFRMGDFYEMFFADAEVAARALDLALTSRSEHQGQRIPMCGVPAHAMEGYLARLIRQGFRVALCEQLETPDEAKKRKAPALKRGVVRVVTPGTVTEEALLEAARPAWLLALVPEKPGGAGPNGAGPNGAGEETASARLGAAWLDVSTGAFATLLLPAVELTGLLARLDPAEILRPESLGSLPALFPYGERQAVSEPPRDPARPLCQHFGVTTLEGFGSFSGPELAAAAMALEYVQAMQGSLPRLSPPAPQGGQGLLALDAATRRSLEITAAQSGGRAGSLLAAVDRTVTAAGGRELGSRLAAPLAELPPILARHEAVEALLAAPAPRASLRAALKGAPDMARALARLSVERHTPRDLAALRDGLAAAEVIAGVLAAMPVLPLLLQALAEKLLPTPNPQAELARALAETLPARIEEPGSIAVGYDGELDALRRLRDDARGAIAAMQMELAQAWGVASIKIRHHQQLGYMAELPSAAGEKLLRDAPLPADHPQAPIHRQSMANAHRFTCTALASLDRRLSEAGEQALKRERLVLTRLRALALEGAPGIAQAAAALAELDVHAAAAQLASEGVWCRPELAERAEFRIRAGRHPVVEAALAASRGPAFVPNGCDLSPGRRLCLLTGPNMAGKSTYLRQNALIVILAQAGLFVPAEACRLGLVDKLFSRVGAADDLAGGRSTFMVEMAETAAILNQAGPHSLVVLDEVGRGTATWDGLAIAWSVLEALHDRLRCRTLFATHFHELVGLAAKLPEMHPAAMEVQEWRGQVVFRHSVVAGAAERSWGLHVAKLAGVPKAVLTRAAEVLASLESRAKGLDPLAEELPLFGAMAVPAATSAAGPAPETAGTSSSAPNPVLAALAALDLDELSPRAAQAALYDLQRRLKDTPAHSLEGNDVSMAEPAGPAGRD